AGEERARKQKRRDDGPTAQRRPQRCAVIRREHEADGEVAAEEPSDDAIAAIVDLIQNLPLVVGRQRGSLRLRGGGRKGQRLWGRDRRHGWMSVVSAGEAEEPSMPSYPWRAPGEGKSLLYAGYLLVSRIVKS